MRFQGSMHPTTSPMIDIRQASAISRQPNITCDQRNRSFILPGMNKAQAAIRQTSWRYSQCVVHSASSLFNY